MGKLNELVINGVKKYGDSRVMDGLSELRAMKQNMIDFPRLPTGVFPLDYSLGGGVLLNSATQFFGPPESGKSTAAYLTARSLAGMCTRAGCLKPLALCKCDEPLIQKTFLAQFEGTPPDDLWFSTLGYEPDGNLVIGMPDYAEQGCEMIEAAIKSDDCGLVIIDSVGAMMTKAELQSSYEDALVASQSKLLTRLARRLSNLLVQELRRSHLVAVIFINQVRSTIGSIGYGANEGVPGGYALKHCVRLSVRFSQYAATGDERSDENVKNVLKTTTSLLSNAAKQQAFIMAGKAEYKLAIAPYRDYPPGRVLDVGTVLKYAKDLGVFVGDSKSNYAFPSLGWEFARLMDVEAVFRTGEHVGLQGADDAIRYTVVQEAKQRMIQRLTEENKRRVIRVEPPEGGK